jgi:Flp pilus assembly protein TadD
LLKISSDALWHIQRGDGFLDLKMIDKARQELEQVGEFDRRCNSYIEAALRLAMADSRWSDAAQLARTLIERRPKEPAFHIQLAYSIRRAESIEAARDILRDARKHFPKVAVIPFNLACYECQLGHPDEAMALLEKAFKLDASFREQAFEDDDLKPIWAKLGQ